MGPSNNTEWNVECQVATKVEETFWTVEIAIPIAQFQRQIKPGDIWGFNLARIVLIFPEDHHIDW